MMLSTDVLGHIHGYVIDAPAGHRLGMSVRG